MVKLQEQLKYFVHNKLSTDKLWQNVRVYLSGHEVCISRLLPSVILFQQLMNIVGTEYEFFFRHRGRENIRSWSLFAQRTENRITIPTLATVFMAWMPIWYVIMKDICTQGLSSVGFKLFIWKLLRTAFLYLHVHTPCLHSLLRR